MVDDDVLFRFRLRLFSLAAELGNVREACRLMGVHPSTYYRWRGPVLRSGLEMLRPRERRHAADAQPDEPARRAADRRLQPGSPGPRAAADQRDPRPGALGRHRRQSQRRLAGPPAARPVSRRISRLSPRRRLCRAARARAARRRSSATSRSTTRASSSGFDCFHVGRLAGTTGRVWQYTAIDLASVVRLGRAGDHAAQPVGRPDVGARPAGRGRPARPRLAARAGPDRQRLASSARRSSATPSASSVPSRRSSGPGRPATNGAVERVQRTILEECWRPCVRPEPGAQAGRPRPRPRRLPRLLQPRARPHRSADPWPDPVQALVGARKMRPTMTAMRRYISEAVQASSSESKTRGERSARSGAAARSGTRHARRGARPGPARRRANRSARRTRAWPRLQRLHR